jgi:hypothetical protein
MAKKTSSRGKLYCIIENMEDGFLYVLQTNICTIQKLKLNIPKNAASSKRC